MFVVCEWIIGIIFIKKKKKKSNFNLKKYELPIIDNMGMGKASSFRRESTRNFSYCLAIYDKKKKFSAINLKLVKF